MTEKREGGGVCNRGCLDTHTIIIDYPQTTNFVHVDKRETSKIDYASEAVPCCLSSLPNVLVLSGEQTFLSIIFQIAHICLHEGECRPLQTIPQSAARNQSEGFIPRRMLSFRACCPISASTQQTSSIALLLAFFLLHFEADQSPHTLSQMGISTGAADPKLL